MQENDMEPSAYILCALSANHKVRYSVKCWKIGVDFRSVSGRKPASSSSCWGFLQQSFYITSKDLRVFVSCSCVCAHGEDCRRLWVPYSPPVHIEDVCIVYHRNVKKSKDETVFRFFDSHLKS